MSSTITVYNQEGEKTGTHKLSADVFGVEPKTEVMHQAVRAMLANRRRPWAHAKSRGEVRGGGKKPWRQKGTGRARAGSIRSPIWRGGGVTFGPRPERNYSQKINKKTKRIALLMSLSDKAKNKKIFVVDKIALPEVKTKLFYAVVQKIIPEEKKILFTLPKKDDKLIRAARNIKTIKIIPVESLNILDIVGRGCLFTTLEGIKKIEKYFQPIS